VILTIWSDRDNAPLAKCLSERLAVITFIETDAFWSAFPFSDPDAVNRFQDVTLIMMISATDGEI
jgi:hypothetical protein